MYTVTTTTRAVERLTVALTYEPREMMLRNAAGVECSIDHILIAFERSGDDTWGDPATVEVIYRAEDHLTGKLGHSHTGDPNMFANPALFARMVEAHRPTLVTDRA
ncbi:hypothetical protein [Leucobacter sp. cx-169]|uniref:hypothetical protein n=1 Tax=Leucobacter sp. cx-169 TaxID=2770549 RepID=UPI00165E6816|nr:hypothetical protein [Leucobacter sp. cx-169]MBC9927214.1 hypothetical protein [Leucobacter sp. cx-169]